MRICPLREIQSIKARAAYHRRPARFQEPPGEPQQAPSTQPQILRRAPPPETERQLPAVCVPSTQRNTGETPISQSDDGGGALTSQLEGSTLDQMDHQPTMIHAGMKRTREPTPEREETEEPELQVVTRKGPGRPRALTTATGNHHDIRTLMNTQPRRSANE
jgi:hypothetical protein